MCDHNNINDSFPVITSAWLKFLLPVVEQQIIIFRGQLLFHTGIAFFLLINQTAIKKLDYVFTRVIFVYH